MSAITDTALFTISVDGYGNMIAYSPQSGYELARAPVRAACLQDDNSTESHIVAAQRLVRWAFEDLEAQGYAHAHDKCDNHAE